MALIKFMALGLLGFLLILAVNAKESEDAENERRYITENESEENLSDDVESREKNLRQRENSREGKATKIRVVHVKPMRRPPPKKYYKIWTPHKKFIKMKHIRTVPHGMRRKNPAITKVPYRRRKLPMPKRNPSQRPRQPAEVYEYDYHVYEDDVFDNEIHRNEVKHGKTTHRSKKTPSVSYSNFVQHSGGDEEDYVDSEPVQREKDRRKQRRKTKKTGKKKTKPSFDDQYGAHSSSLEDVASEETVVRKTPRRPLPQVNRDTTPIYGDGYLGNHFGDKGEPSGLSRYQQQVFNRNIYPQNIQLSPQNQNLIYPIPNNFQPQPGFYNNNNFFPRPNQQQPSHQFSSQYSNSFENNDPYKNFGNNGGNFQPSENLYSSQQENNFATRHSDFYVNGFKGTSVKDFQSNNKKESNQESKTDFDIGYGEIPYDESQNK